MTVSEQIIEVLNYLGQKFGIAIDWTSESVVPAMQNLMSKYIKWEIATSIGWLVFAVTIIGIYIGLVVLYHKKANPRDRWDFGYGIAPWAIVIIGSFLFVLIIPLIICPLLSRW